MRKRKSTLGGFTHHSLTTKMKMQMERTGKILLKRGSRWGRWRSLWQLRIKMKEIEIQRNMRIFMRSCLKLTTSMGRHLVRKSNLMRNCLIFLMCPRCLWEMWGEIDHYTYGVLSLTLMKEPVKFNDFCLLLENSLYLQTCFLHRYMLGAFQQISLNSSSSWDFKHCKWCTDSSKSNWIFFLLTDLIWFHILKIK